MSVLFTNQDHIVASLQLCRYGRAWAIPMTLNTAPWITSHSHLCRAWQYWMDDITTGVPTSTGQEQLHTHTRMHAHKTTQHKDWQCSFRSYTELRALQAIKPTLSLIQWDKGLWQPLVPKATSVQTVERTLHSGQCFFFVVFFRVVKAVGQEPLAHKAGAGSFRGQRFTFWGVQHLSGFPIHSLPSLLIYSFLLSCHPYTVTPSRTLRVWQTGHKKHDHLMPLWMLLIRNVYQILGSPPVATFENNRPRENSVYKTCPCVLGGYHGCVCLKISAGLNPASYGICAVKWACNKVWNVSCFMLGCNSKQSMIKK